MNWAAATIADTDLRSVDGETALIVWLRQPDGREIEDTIILDGPDCYRVEAGERQLASLCRASGWWQPLLDSNALHGRRCYVRVRAGRIKYWPASLRYAEGAA